ncbi:MAG: hypothetical protein C4519_20775 [Desulfobacteraceae bacterium]|nr:MAG: hypothetical protein C4519_20775 [Desulfobacteraceae bacterium]
MNKYSWFGGIGAVAGANKDSMLFQEYLEKNGIKISEIALNSFKTALAQKGMFNISEDSPTKLKITVNTYGFGAAGAFDKENVKPLINITAALSKHDDNILWKKTDYVTNLSSKLTKYPFEQLAKDPSLVKISLAEASDIVIESILNDFK